VILAGDVGGTKCNLALFSEKGGTLTPVFKQRFASQGIRAIRAHRQGIFPSGGRPPGKESIVAAGFGIAGPVINGTVRATNLPWIVDTKSLVKELNVPHVVLLNDLGATGHSIEHLPPQDFCVLNPGNPEPGGTRALIAAGTGLASRFLCGTAAATALCLPKAAIPISRRTPSSRSNSCASCAAAILK